MQHSNSCNSYSRESRAGDAGAAPRRSPAYLLAYCNILFRFATTVFFSITDSRFYAFSFDNLIVAVVIKTSQQPRADSRRSWGTPASFFIGLLNKCVTHPYLDLVIGKSALCSLSCCNINCLLNMFWSCIRQKHFNAIFSYGTQVLVVASTYGNDHGSGTDQRFSTVYVL